MSGGKITVFKVEAKFSPSLSLLEKKGLIEQLYNGKDMTLKTGSSIFGAKGESATVCFSGYESEVVSKCHVRRYFNQVCLESIGRSPGSYLSIEEIKFDDG